MEQTTAMKEQLQEAWRTNNKINLLFVELLGDDDMQKTLSVRGSRTVYEQLVHLHQVRMQWMPIVAKEIFLSQEQINMDHRYNKELLFEALEESGKGIEKIIDKSWDKEGKLTGFKKGLVPFISYLIAHEAHHRGNILLTLKQCGVKVPDELKWRIWEWNKI